MDIRLSIEDGLNDKEKAFLMDGPSGMVISEVKMFIQQRLSVLGDEIEKQRGWVVFEINPPSMKYYNVTEELYKKMKECITQEDHDYLTDLIWGRLYPGILPPTS